MLHNTGKARFRSHATAIASASDAPFEDVFKSRVGEHNRWPAVGPGRRRTAGPLAAVSDIWRSSAKVRIRNSRRLFTPRQAVAFPNRFAFIRRERITDS